MYNVELITTSVLIVVDADEIVNAVIEVGVISFVIKLYVEFKVWSGLKLLSSPTTEIIKLFVNASVESYIVKSPEIVVSPAISIFVLWMLFLL
jgi:hypothetical protein